MNDQDEKVLKASRFFTNTNSKKDKVLPDSLSIQSGEDANQLPTAKAKSISSENFKLNLSIRSGAGNNSKGKPEFQKLDTKEQEREEALRTQTMDMPSYQRGLRCKAKLAQKTREIKSARESGRRTTWRAPVSQQ